MSRDIPMMISTLMANLQSTRRCSKTRRSLSWLCDLVHETICDGESFPVEGEQQME
jgi:hypothetical protein